MEKYNIFQRMERKIDFQFEYEKIEGIILNENDGHQTIENEIEDNFSSWSYKGNYLSFLELRSELGFTYECDERWELIPQAQITKIDEFILYCDMILNMFYVLWEKNKNFWLRSWPPYIQKIIDIIKYDLDKIGHKIYETKDGKILIVQKDPAAVAVADIVEPNLADTIMEYNHYLLKGDMKTKQSILKIIADALEPKRANLRQANKKIETEFFYLVNNMNVRHNNCDESNLKCYNEKFAKLSEEEKEEWYDEIYQESLMAFLVLEQVERTKKIEEFKNICVS